ncbi:hypothetical protein ACQPT2_18940 [Erwinia amylovora]
MLETTSLTEDLLASIRRQPFQLADVMLALKQTARRLITEVK